MVTKISSSLNYTKMSTDDEKTKIAKLVKGLEVPDLKLSERCSELIKVFHEKFDKEIEQEEKEAKSFNDEVWENPYKVDKMLLDENERKLKQVLEEYKR